MQWNDEPLTHDIIYQKYITMILLSNFFTWSTCKITFRSCKRERTLEYLLFNIFSLSSGFADLFFVDQSWNLELTTLSFLTLRPKRSKEISKSLSSATRRPWSLRNSSLGNTKLACLASGSAKLLVDLKVVTSLAHRWLGRTTCKCGRLFIRD